MYSKENIGKLIKILRKNIFKENQVTISSSMGISQGQLSKIENGEYEVSAEELFRFLDGTEVNIEVFRSLLIEQHNMEDLDKDDSKDEILLLTSAYTGQWT